jgi:uncharacterized protein (TIRG00374 family)
MSARKNLLIVLFIIGLALFVFLILRIGPAEIWAALRRLTWTSALVLFALRSLFWIQRAYIWKLIYESRGGRAPFFTLFWARMAGYAFSYVAPAGQLSGEAVRVLVVKAENTRLALASVVVDKTMELLTAFLFATGSLVLTLLSGSLPGSYKMLFLCVTAGIGLVTAFLLIKQRTGMFAAIAGVLTKLRIRPRFIEKNREKIAETDAAIADIYARRKKLVVRVFFLNVLSMLLWSLEIYLTVLFLGIQTMNFLESTLVVSLGILAFVILIIPGSLGTYEAVFVLLFSFFGVDSIRGIAATLIRRVLALVWVGAGMTAMGLMLKGPKGKRSGT